MTRFAGSSPKQERITFEPDFSAENQARCEGRKSIAVGCYCGARAGEDVCDKCGAPFSVLVRCVDPHPHQVQLMVMPDGQRYERPLALIGRLMTEAQLRAAVEKKKRTLDAVDRRHVRADVERVTAFSSVAQALPQVNEEVVQRVNQAVSAGALDEATCPDCSKTRSACLCDIPF